MQPRDPHPESLMRLSLVRQMVTDPTVQLRPRRIDARWRDEKKIPLSMTGFNPFLGAVFYARESALSRWLADPHGSARGHNREDRLLYDLFFAVHDYLHVWGTRLIQQLAPEVAFGTAALTAENLEDHVFCQLLSEAVATVGLDYWYLCTFNLNEAVPIGSCKSGGLTVSYKEQHLGEYRRFYPGLDVQRPGFLAELCRFYCSGEFLGFDADDLRQSPLLSSWLTHEVVYGEKQREYSRLWFRYLAGQPADGGAADLTAPIDADVPWRAALMTAVGEALWRKVKEDQLTPLPAPAAAPWRSPVGAAPDFRFCNVGAIGEHLPPPALTAEQFDYYFCQVVSAHDRAAFEPELLKILPSLRERRDAPLLRAVLGGQRKIEAAADEPQDLLFLN
jgi:hypothetical protein